MEVWRRMRTAVRSLARSPGFTIPVFGILALGIGAAVAIFTVVHGVLLRPLDLPDARELVVLCEEHASLQGACIGSVPTIEELGRRASSLQAAGTARGWSFTLEEAGERESVSAGIASPGFFRALGVTPAVGRLFREDEVGPDGDGVLLLTHAFWRDRYGADPAVVGRVVTVDGEPATVVGVLPAGFEVPGLEWPAFWRPVHVDPADDTQREWRGFRTVARLAPGADLRIARTELEGLYRSLGREHPAIGTDWRLSVGTLHDQVVGHVRPTLHAFLAAVAFLLAIGCANVTHLLLARSTGRRRELAVRAALGARPEQLVGHVLAESVVLAGAAGAAGLLLGWAGTRLFVGLAPPGIPRLDAVAVDPTVVLFSLAVTAAVVAAFALVPALRAGEADPTRHLVSPRDGGDGRGGRALRRGLVIAELALSVVLLFGSGLLARSFAGYVGWEPGFEREGLRVIWALGSGEAGSADDVADFWRRVEADLAALPGVRSVATASAVPLYGGRETGELRFQGGEGLADDALPSARWYDVGPGYFETLGVSLVRGRAFRESDGPGAPGVAVVNEAFVRSVWPGTAPEAALGRWIEPREARTRGRLTVVGVVADVPPLTPGLPAEPAMYWSNRQFGRVASTVLIRTEPGAGPSPEAVRSTLEGVDPAMGMSALRSMEELMEGPLARPRFTFLLVAAFATVALVLSVAGVYGVLAYTVARRLRAIGIRMALGSPASRVVGGIVGEAGLLATAGGVLGALGAWAAWGLLSSLVAGVAPTDPLTVVATAAVLGLAALAGSALPAARASRVDPARLLREE